MQCKINEVVIEQCHKETYQKHLMARILQVAKKTMEEMEKLKLADFKRKDKNARLKDEFKNTKILLQDMRASATEMRNLKDSLEHELQYIINQSQVAMGTMKNELTSEKF